MKTIPLSTAGLALVLATRSAAIEAPADNSPPPPSGPAHPAPAARPEVRAETAYLGVVTSDVPEMLATHLGIKPGEGIMVSAVMPDGPAAKAGITAHDIITRVGDKQTGSPEDLTLQVTSGKPGDTIRLSLIHEGKAMERDAVLGTRPSELADAGPHAPDHLNLNGMPEDLEKRVRDLIQGNLQGLEMHFGEGGDLQALPQVEELMRGMQERMEKALSEMAAPDQAAAPAIPKAPAGHAPDLQQGATVRIMDNQGSIELKSMHGGKEVTVRDKENNLTWTGPWDTEQDKAAAPDAVRERVDKLNLDTKFQGNGIRLRNLPDPGGH